MKDAEIQDRLGMAIQTLARGDIPGGLAHLHGLSDTLKANPPLAERIAWIMPEHIKAFKMAEHNAAVALIFSGAWAGWLPVTVAIRKRGA